SRPLRKLVKSPNPLPMSNIKILHPEVPYDEEFSAVWPYRETFFGEKINNSAKCPTISHSNFRRSGAASGVLGRNLADLRHRLRHPVQDPCLRLQRSRCVLGTGPCRARPGYGLGS